MSIQVQTSSGEGVANGEEKVNFVQVRQQITYSDVHYSHLRVISNKEENGYDAWCIYCVYILFTLIQNKKLPFVFGIGLATGC